MSQSATAPAARGGVQRAAPHDLDAERAILGAVLLDSADAVLDSVAGSLEPASFFGDANRLVFTAMLEIRARRQAIDPVTVRARLEAAGQLDRAGGATYLASLIDGIPDGANVSTYARIVLDHARRRAIGNAAQRMAAAALDGTEDLDRLLADVIALRAREFGTEGVEFTRVEEGRYRLTHHALGLDLEVDHLRRERGQLLGELTTRSLLPGARTTGDGVLAAGSFNLSSLQARGTHAKHLAARARSGDAIDWAGVLEELCHRVITSEREGEPAQRLRDMPRPEPVPDLVIHGLSLLARHPVILFGDGGAAKSYLALYVAGTLAQRGIRVGYFDWELAGEDHRLRLDRLFPNDPPDLLWYQRCDRPLTTIIDRVARTVTDHQLGFAIFDSVAFACDGPPEAAEVASRYFQSLRRLGPIGSLHVAHVSKAENSDRRPFGSAFWHNGARATWNAKVADSASDGRRIAVGLYPRKANLARRGSAVGFEFTFSDDETLVGPVDLANVDDLAAELPLHQRIRSYLRGGARTRDEIAAEFADQNGSTLRSAIHRATKRGHLVVVAGSGGQLIGLPERRQS